MYRYSMKFNLFKFTFSVCAILSLIVTGYSMESNNKVTDNDNSNLPLVINTWQFTNATKIAWHHIYKKMSSTVETVEAGCSKCEEEQCDFTVGFGGSPDEKGETTLDAMIMDGNSMDVGSVAGLRKVKHAVSVARRVLENTQHSILAGELATEFARSVGFKTQSLSTNYSTKLWKDWKDRKCQPNFWKNVKPNPETTCGPYTPTTAFMERENEIPVDSENKEVQPHNEMFSPGNHDTITMIVVDKKQNVAVGTSSNGANHKIPGRVGDAPIPGAGAYADSTVGGAAATGDGDIMMRFLPSFLAVEEMRRGASPTEAAETAVKRIAAYYPIFFGAVIAANVAGEYGAACNGMKVFPYSVINPKLKKVNVNVVPCINNL